MDTQAELLKATGVKARRRKEDEQGFLNRIKDAVDKLDEEAWDGLSAAAQDWANNAETARKAESPLPAINGSASSNGGAGPAEAAAEEPAPKGRKGKGKKARAAAAAAEEETGKGKRARGKKAKAGGTQTRSSADTKIKKLVKELPPGNRNEHWGKVRDGTKIGDIRKDKTLLRVTRYWRRKKFVEFVNP